jgi:uncharacterized protein (UPF0332 family)
MDLFVTPELQRRQNAGELPKPLDLRVAQIIFYPDGRKPQVRINCEVKAIGKVKLKSGISKKVGEPIYEHEVEGLEKINLSEGDDPDCGHATLVRVENRWIIAFDFRYNKALSKKHIETAQQFFESAEFSFKQKNWSPFIDNLFSAAELSVKAILLSMSDPKFRKKATHNAIQTRYNRFADLGNVEAVYKNTFNKLSSLRVRARYLKENFSISEEEARTFLNTIRNMIEDATLRIKG